MSKPLDQDGLVNLWAYGPVGGGLGGLLSRGSISSFDIIAQKHNSHKKLALARNYAFFREGNS